MEDISEIIPQLPAKHLRMKPMELEGTKAEHSSSVSVDFLPEHYYSEEPFR